MSYTKQLPHIGDLVRLSKLVKRYPTTRDKLMWFARMRDLGDDVCDFLQQFPADRVFLSPEDFITQTEELETLINQEWDTPPEILCSPQD